MTRSTLGLLLLTTLGLSTTGAAEDAAADSGETGAALRIVWKKKIGSGYSGVAVGDGRAVTMYADGASDVMAAFDLADGK